MKETIERFGIYGGTFSPIHCGHVKAALRFLEEMHLDKLLIIPTAKPPHKAEVLGAGGEERLTMARLAFCKTEEYAEGKIEISDFEILRGEKSYTINTLEHFNAAGRRIYLLMGTDMFLTLDKWYRAADIFALADIVLMRRENSPEYPSKIEEKNSEYVINFGARTHFIKEKPIEISSTELREKLCRGEDISEFVPAEVCKYIAENWLYR